MSATLLLGCIRCFYSRCISPSLGFWGCHFESLLSSPYPFPLLTHLELSIAAASFPRSSPLSCLRAFSRYLSSFPISQFGPLLHASPFTFPCSAPCATLGSLPHSACLSLRVTVGYRSAGRLGWLVSRLSLSLGGMQRSTLTSAISALQHYSSIDCLAVSRKHTRKSTKG